MDKPLDQRRFIWIIDDADKLVHVNDDWLAFAAENTAPQLTAALVLDQPIWRFIQGQETSYLYQQIFRRVRAGKAPVRFPFRSDSPDCRRFMQMQLVLLPGAAIQFTTHILREEWRDPIDLLDASRDRTQEFVKVCSWCKRINIPGRGWGEIEAAIVALDLFGHHSMPRMTHTICDSCRSALSLELPQESGETRTPTERNRTGRMRAAVNNPGLCPVGWPARSGDHKGGGMPRIDDYKTALALAVADLKPLNPKRLENRTGAQHFVDSAQEGLIVPYFGQERRITWPEVSVTPGSGQGEISLPEQVLILHYLLNASGDVLTGRSIDFRQVPEGGFYWSAFVSRAQKPLLSTFGQDLPLYVKVAATLGGEPLDLGDAAARFMAFPRVPITHVLWGGDEEFTPEATILFDETIPRYLPTEDIAALAGASVYRLMGAAHQFRQSR